MLANLAAVQPHRRAPIGCANDEEDPLALPGVRYVHGALIPGDVRTIRHAGERGSPRERNEYGVGRRERTVEPRCQLSLISPFELEPPSTIEILQLRALKSLSRMRQD